MNYGEELAYWYLRLNGFFLLSNFVVHRSDGVRYTSDIDVFAIRPPYVFEPVGGQPDDWDKNLASELKFGRLIGVICEVKTGVFDKTKLFQQKHLQYAVGRLGLVDPAQVPSVVAALNETPLLDINNTITLCKLLICSQEEKSKAYITRTLATAEDFLAERVRRFPQEKYADRMFFSSQLFQFVIAQVHREIERRENRPNPLRMKEAETALARRRPLRRRR